MLAFNSDRKIFFTSDTHFGHKNILKYCNRPFDSVDEMDEKIIENWNSVVPKDGLVFHLGDVAFYDEHKATEILNRLNGSIILVRGNHDKKLNTGGRFSAVMEQLSITVDQYKIILNHYPMLCFAGSYGNMNSEYHTWQLFGHVHSGPYSNTGLDHQRLINLFPTQYDVGVDNNNFTPVSFEQVKEIITDQLLSQNIYRK